MRDHGAQGDGRTDDTAAFQAAIDVAATILGRVVVPPGSYVVDSVTIPRLVKLEGVGADTGRYTPYAKGGVNLLHAPAATEPLLVVDGGAVSLEFLALFGNGSKAPLISVLNGFESKFNRVHLFEVDGTALLVERVNNNNWSDLFVDGCGSATAAAVVVKSPDDPAKISNTFTCYNLTIEQSPNVALDLAWGDSLDCYIEFVRLTCLHVEGYVDPAVGALGNTDPLIRIGNVRHVELADAFVYGGPGSLIEHRQSFALPAPLSGGIRLLGGAFLGADESKTGQPSPCLIALTRGDDFAAVGARFGRYSESAITARREYGGNVRIDPTTTTTESTASLLVDVRDLTTRPSWRWPGSIRVADDIVISGHLRTERAGTNPTATPLPANGAAPDPPAVTGTDTAGIVYFSSGPSATKGAQVRVEYARPRSATPGVMICPAKYAGASRTYYATSSKTGFEVVFADSPPINLPINSFAFSYIVIE